MTEIIQFDTYLSSLRSYLRPLAPNEREEILREITAHIRDSAEQNGASVETVLAKLGSPKELAAQYRDGQLMRRATRSISPLLLLRAALRMATKGVSGIVVFFAAVFGYVLGAGLVLSAFAKCIFPAHTGMWIRGGEFIGAGTQLYVPQAPAQEILGWWYVLIALTLGSLITLFTTFVIRKSLRISQTLQSKL